MRSSLGKTSALFSSCVTKTLDVCTSSSKSPSVGPKKSEIPHIASGWEEGKKPNEDPSSGNENIDAESVQADVLYCSYVLLSRVYYFLDLAISLYFIIQKFISRNTVLLFILLFFSPFIAVDKMLWYMVCLCCSIVHSSITVSRYYAAVRVFLVN